MRVCAVIPARYGSTRLPGKPLLKETGKYLIQHVVEQVAQAKSVDRILVATDDERIRRAVEEFGGEAVMTSASHRSGTDRIAEAVKDLEVEIVVNVQGDEPEIEPSAIEAVVRLLEEDAASVMSTVAFASDDAARALDPHQVKVVCDAKGDALYFSRAPIPARKDADARPIYWFHLGLYGYRKAFLLELSRLPPSRLEELESLEQLRALENGYRIRVGQVGRESIGIDTPEDYRRFVERQGRPEQGGP